MHAEADYQRLLLKQTFSCAAAASAYQQRRARPPPPGFAAWFKLASAYEAVIIEEFWDPIYDDLAPFWGLSPVFLRSITRNMTMNSGENNIDGFWIRDGKVCTNCDNADFCDVFLEMVREVTEAGAGALPDMEIPFNAFISPRILVPWEDMERLRQKAEKEYSDPIEGLDRNVRREEITEKVEIKVTWENSQFKLLNPNNPWSINQQLLGNNFPAIIQAACPPDSMIRGANLLPRYMEVAVSMKSASLHTQGGFVSNFQLSKNPCHQPDLLYLHGSLMSPSYTLTTQQLFPLFSVQQIANVNHEIRVPSTYYWNEEPLYHSADTHDAGNWSLKANKLFWRGGNSGGRVYKDNWKGFQRHRFVTMTNATEIEQAEQSGECTLPWAMSDIMCKFVRNGGDRHALSRFVRANTDIGFYAFGCSDQDSTRPGGEMGCSYLDDHYETISSMKFSKMQSYKYLADLDGNGYSG
jgi:hypothetical protein